MQRVKKQPPPPRGWRMPAEWEPHEATWIAWPRDVKVPQHINRRLKLPIWEPTHQGRRVVLEGGSIDVNGQSILLTTEECLLSPIQARNPGMTRADLEQC